MYVCTLKLISDQEPVLVRIDLSNCGDEARYRLTDTNGDIHEFTSSLNVDNKSKTFEDRALYSIANYLQSCYERDWRGCVYLAQPAMALGGIEMLLAEVNYLVTPIAQECTSLQ